MITPNDKVIEALAKSEHDVFFKEILAWLQRSLDRVNEQLAEENNDVALRQAQGEARALREILTNAQNARSLHKKLLR